MLNIDAIDNGDFYFNGKWLSSFGGIIAGQSGISPFSLLPQLDKKTEKVLGRDGEIIYDATYSPRTFTIPVLFDDLRRIREIAGWLNARTAKPFYLKGDSVQIDCMIDSVLDIQSYCYQGTVELKFIAYNPFFYAIKDRKYIINKSASNSTTTDSVNNIVTKNMTSISNVVITNDGNLESYPIYKVVGVGTLDLTVNGNKMSVTNVTDYVVIDTKYCKVYKDGASPVNFIGKFTGEFQMLQVGDNKITASSNCTSVEIQCRSQWI